MMPSRPSSILSMFLLLALWAPVKSTDFAEIPGIDIERGNVVSVMRETSPNFAWYDTSQTMQCLEREGYKKVVLLGDSSMNEVIDDFVFLLTGLGRSLQKMDDLIWSLANLPDGVMEATIPLPRDFTLYLHDYKRNCSLVSAKSEISIHYRFTGHHTLWKNFEGAAAFSHPDFERELDCLLGLHKSGCPPADLLILGSNAHDQAAKMKESAFRRHIGGLYNRIRSDPAGRRLRVIWRSPVLTELRLYQANMVGNYRRAAHDMALEHNATFANMTDMYEVARAALPAKALQRTTVDDFLHVGSISKYKFHVQNYAPNPYMDHTMVLSSLCLQYLLNFVCHGAWGTHAAEAATGTARTGDGSEAGGEGRPAPPTKPAKPKPSAGKGLYAPLPPFKATVEAPWDGDYFIYSAQYRGHRLANVSFAPAKATYEQREWDRKGKVTGEFIASSSCPALAFTGGNCFAVNPVRATSLLERAHAWNGTTYEGVDVGLNIGTVPPLTILERLKGRKIAFAGDSTMSQIFIAWVCHLHPHTNTKFEGTWPSYLDKGACPHGSIACHLMGGQVLFPKFDIEMSYRQENHYPQDGLSRWIADYRLRLGDILFTNSLGLHYNDKGSLLSALGRFSRDLTLWNNTGVHIHLLEALPQHFPDTGAWRPSQAEASIQTMTARLTQGNHSLQCAPWDSDSPPRGNVADLGKGGLLSRGGPERSEEQWDKNDPVLRRDWRNTLIHDRLAASGQQAVVVVYAQALFRLYDEHIDGGDHKTARLQKADCTHWCLYGLGFKILTSAMLSCLFRDVPQESAALSP